MSGGDNGADHGIRGAARLPMRLRRSIIEGARPALPMAG
jgi:hypothetical protein